MLNSMKFKYANVHSLIHIVNPTLKIISLLIFVICTFIANEISMHILLLGLLLLLLLGSKIKLKSLLITIYRLKYLLIFYIIISLLFKTSVLSISLTLLRIIEIIIYTNIVMYTTEPNDIIYAFEESLSPFKNILPVKEIALILGLSFRFIPTIIDKFNKIIKSLTSRGHDYRKGTIKQKIESLRAVIIPVFVVSFKKSDEVATSMEVRQYNMKQKRLPYKEIKIELADIIYIADHLILMFVLILWRFLI